MLEVERHAEPHAAWNAVWAATVPSLARRSSLRTSFSRAVAKSGGRLESVVLSAVLEKWEFRPQRRLKTSYETTTV